MKVFSVRLEDAQVEALEALGRRRGATASDIVREFVERGLAAGPQPAPPTPPVDPGPGPISGDGLPAALADRLNELRRDLAQLGRYRVLGGLQYWAPKLLALAAACVPFGTGDPHAQSTALSGLMAVLLIDAIWLGRDSHRDVLKRGTLDLGVLIQDVPGLYAQARRTKSQDAAAADVLAEVAQRRERLGELGVKDLGLGAWNPG